MVFLCFFLINTFLLGPFAVADRAGISTPMLPINQITNPFDLLGRLSEPNSLQRLDAILKKQGYPKQSDPFGRSLLTAAIFQSSKETYTDPSDIMSGRDESIHLVLKYAPSPCGPSGTETPLHAAAKNGNIYWIYELLDKKCAIDILNADGNTPLLESIWRQNEATRLLLSRGANPEISNKNGQTPLGLATLYYKNIEITKILLSYGANPKLTYDQALVTLKDNSDFSLSLIADLLKDAIQNKRPLKVPPKEKPLLPPVTDSAFIQSIKEGKTDTALSFLKKGANPNSLSRPFNRAQHDFKEAEMYGTSALHLAIKKSQYDLAKALIQRGGNVNLQSSSTAFSDGLTPLILALDDLEMTKFLVSHNADVNKPAAKGRTPIFYAKKLEVVRFLVSKGADINKVVLSGTPLHFAILEKQDAKVELLLDLKADPNARNLFDFAPPLFTAIETGNEKVVKLLLEKGANRELKNNQNLNAYEYALHSKQVNLASLLKGSKTGYNDPSRALSQAIQDKNVPWVESLLKEGLDVNGNSQWPYLMQAAQIWREDSARRQIIKLLLAKGADSKVIDSNRQSLLHLVPDVEVAKLLLDKGLNINIGNFEEQTPLHVWAQNGELEMVELLLSRKANVSATDKYQRTPLHMAAEGPIDHQPADGPPPNWEVEGPRYLRIIELLKKAGADALAKGGYNKETPVDIVKKSKNPDFKKKALATLEFH